MHLDEYEISLARELGLCDSFVRKCQRLLEKMEARYGMTTEMFMDRWQKGTITASREFRNWRDGVDGLRHWSEARDEYARLLRIMKI